jgi:hypothetical protein
VPLDPAATAPNPGRNGPFLHHQEGKPRPVRILINYSIKKSGQMEREGGCLDVNFHVVQQNPRKKPIGQKKTIGKHSPCCKEKI